MGKLLIVIHLTNALDDFQRRHRKQLGNRFFDSRARQPRNERSPLGSFHFSPSFLVSSVKVIGTDAAEDAVSSLELAASFLESAVTDDRYWKWFVVATHGAVQGIFVLALKAGDGLLVQKPGVTKKMIAAYDADTDPPSPHMDNFFNLYKKLHKKENLRSSDSIPVPPSEVHEKAVKSLDELRDEFLHFNTKSWSIERELIFVCARECVELMDFIISKSSTIIWYQQDQKERVHVALERLKLLLNVQNSASSP
jgi:hypothetical protein